ncbi:predicted protein [Streptomyces viridosporus ATCC 14672]|uniref:Predicted protein n=1 Tax=Streptomyces viridosporus (strain ATCC 14672 / DSM 40746 / JCM 4963 / KCTC 9882 / NRRL B-12104 / FH 1290) TaxID=566461 RepID=D6A4I7_STRV1|nr:hypothetical protein [Streptomyces viridosporus]EFE65827.1 predicted protein [Streptomyces viridosporus ATCC 14672]
MSDEHVQHTWNLARDDADEVTVELWTDGYTVRVTGGDGEDSEGGRKAVDALLGKYRAAGYRLVRDYPVNDAEPQAADVEDDAEPDGKPEECPECGGRVEFEPGYCTDLREGDAWLCTGCRWGEWLTA